MLKKFFRKLAVLAMTALLFSVMTLPTVSAYTYTGANGTTYTDADFEFANTDIDVEPMYEGYARFCLETPEKYYEGYAVYAVEGDLGNLDQYDPTYYSKNTICYVYPEKFTYDTSVSVHIYPYIELESGAFKFLQPGYVSEAQVDVDDDDDEWLSAVTITATSEDGGIYVDWNELSGLGDTFEKYNVLFKKGYYSSLTSATDVAKSYVTWDYYNLVGLTEGDWWTFQVVPVKTEGTGYVETGTKSNVLQVQVKGDTSVDDLDTPYITSPYANQVYTNYPRTAYISWTSVAGAAKYEVEVACDVCTSTTTKWLNPSTFTSTKNYLTTTALAGDNEFRVKVRALDSSESVKSSWSSYVYFSYDTSDYADDDTVYDMSLAITSWDDNGLPYVVWSAYTGTFDGYVLFVREGFWDENEVTHEGDSYLGKTTTFQQMAKMKEYTTYTARVLPYINITNGKTYVFPGSNTLHFTTGADNDDDSDQYTGQTLPPAGYEDEVITTFDYYNNPFPDTDLSTLKGQAAAELYRRGVIGGFPDGQFKGDREVNRAELAKFLLLARYGYVADVSNNGQFSDVLEGEWYVKFVVTAANLGIISGYQNGTFGPGNAVNVAEFMKMITLTFDLPTNLPYSYNDVDESDWYAKYAGVAKAYDLFPNNGNYLYPGSEMTRYEVAVAIYQFLLNR